MLWYDKDIIGTILPRCKRKSHTTQNTVQNDQRPSSRPRKPPKKTHIGILTSRFREALCMPLPRSSPRPSISPMGNAPRLRFDDCHHEVHISGGAAETPSQLQSYQRSAGIMTRAKNSCLEKLEDARLARRRYSRRAAAGRQGASRLRTPTTLCCSTTPWSSANKVSGAEGGGWALKIHFAMEFKVQSEPRPDERPAPSQMQGMSSVACNAAP